MLQWPHDYRPAYPVETTVDEYSIEEEPFENPQQAAVYAWQIVHLIDAALLYAQPQQAETVGDERTRQQAAYTAYLTTLRALSVARYAATHTTQESDQHTVRAIVQEINERAPSLDAYRRTPRFERWAWTEETLLADIRMRQDAIHRMAQVLHEPPPQLAPMLSPDIRLAWVKGRVSAAAETAASPDFIRPELQMSRPCQEELQKLRQAATETLEEHCQLIKLHVSPNVEPPQELIDECRKMLLFPDQTPVDVHPIGERSGTVLVLYNHRGSKRLQSISELFPEDTNRQYAEYITRNVKGALEYHTAMNPDDPHLTRYWELFHRLQAATNLGLHAIPPYEMDMLATLVAANKREMPGVHRYVANGLTMGNQHAAQFLEHTYMLPHATAVTDQQGMEIIDAARETGLDEFHLANVAYALGKLPEDLGLVPPSFSEEQKAGIGLRLPENAPYECKVALLRKLGIESEYADSDDGIYDC